MGRGTVRQGGGETVSQAGGRVSARVWGEREWLVCLTFRHVGVRDSETGWRRVGRSWWVRRRAGHTRDHGDTA